MTLTRLTGVAAIVLVASVGQAAGFSLLDEVTVIDPTLGMELVWENPDSKTYCQSSPPDLDRLACTEILPDEFWIGVDAAGNRYGVITGTELGNTYFDIYRRPVGTNFNHHIVRITKRVEVVVGKVVKLFAVGRWEIDLTNGWLLVGLKGDCFTDACLAEPDTNEHLGLVRITGLPRLFEIVDTFQPATTLSFRVPRHPEGLDTGERYDIFAGEVTSLPDLAQAQGVVCDVAGTGVPGTAVDVADPLPAPAAGETRYYVTAVTEGTETRAGRTRQNGTLSGRDGNALQACLMP